LDFLRLDHGDSIEDHAARIARWIFESGQAFFAVLFGDKERAIGTLRKWVIRQSSEFSAFQATLACGTNEPVGMFIGVPGGELDRRRRADLLALIQQTPTAERVDLKAKLQEIGELTAPVSEEHYYIRTLVVDASERGRGTGGRLLDRAIADARALGFSGVRLDVDSDNEPARRLYRRAGFRSIYEGNAPTLRLRMHSMVLTF
jgi:ribosomal protein S18 acetylase RimI-like enzyme